MTLTLAARRTLVAVLAVAAAFVPAAVEPATTSLRLVGASDGVRVQKSSPIVLSGPTSVRTGATIRLTGDVVVRSGSRRTVVLRELRSGRWKRIASTVSARSGAFAFKVAGRTTSGTRAFRAEAPAVGRLAGLRTGTLKVKVVRTSVSAGPTIPGTDNYDAAEGLPAGYDAAGVASDWRYMSEGGSRWTPCTVIRWAYNPTGQPYAALADVKRAVAKISGVSGLKFKYVGSSGFKYVGQVLSAFPSTADLYVSWATATSFPRLAGSTVGVGGGVSIPAGNDTGLGVARRIINGFLTLDRGATTISSGFDGSGWGQIMLHETLHALGLGHAQGTRQVMYSVAGPDNYQFGAGDLTGMAKIGVRDADGCAF